MRIDRLGNYKDVGSSPSSATCLSSDQECVRMCMGVHTHMYVLEEIMYLKG